MLGVTSSSVEVAGLTFRFVIALVFAGAAIPKLLSPQAFERAVANYALLPPRLVRPIARWLPRAELGCSIALGVGLLTRPVAAVASLLLVAFAAGVAVNLLRGREIECGCRGSFAPQRIGWRLVASDLGLAGLAAYVAASVPRALSLDALWTSGSETLTRSDALAVLLFATVLVLGWNLARTWSRFRRAVLKP